MDEDDGQIGDRKSGEKGINRIIIGIEGRMWKKKGRK